MDDLAHGLAVRPLGRVKSLPSHAQDGHRKTGACKAGTCVRKAGTRTRKNRRGRADTTRAVARDADTNSW